MANKLQQYFKNIRTQEEIYEEIQSKEALRHIYNEWNELQQEHFLNICSGTRGVKMLYDGFFKEIFNPDVVPERLEELLSLLLKQKIKILKVLPNDTSRLGDESSLLIMDIVVELEDHSIANVECQKIGYAFPGQRAACYSADLLLRQYKRVRGERGKKFSYKDIKKVYNIIFFEHSAARFHDFPEHSIHHSKQRTNTGLEMNLLQEFFFIPIDIVKKIYDNNGIRNKLDAWLIFLSSDDPEVIVQLIVEYPEFYTLYEEIYNLCQNTERVMNMFSKELLELDRNTVQYMIDEMQDEIDAQKLRIEEQDTKLEKQDIELQEKSILLEEQAIVIARLQEQLSKYQK